MMTWQAFAAERPDLARAGERLLYQFGVGLGFLTTWEQWGTPAMRPRHVHWHAPRPVAKVRVPS
jgi:hypothetical protein